MGKKQFMLGTARWGLFIDQTEAFKILDKYIEMGGKLVDTATNYPINSNSSDFGLAIRWLASWLSSNPGIGLGVYVKIGSRDNSGSAATDLTPSSMNGVHCYLSEVFKENLLGIGIHWDTRDESKSDERSVEKSCEFLSSIQAEGQRIGLSGILNKKAYSKFLKEYERYLIIQIKETITNQNARVEYQEYFLESQYFAYGISGKSHHESEEENRTRYERSIITILQRNEISGVIIGPRNVLQLENSITILNFLIQNLPD